MQTVVLRSVMLDAFKSFRKQTTIVFSPGGGFKFLGGNNVAEPRLGANGAGKTTVWDGVVWVLYETSIKGLKASDLVSWHADKRIHGRVTLTIDGAERVVERWGSPNIVHLDGVKVTQEQLNSVLCLSRSRFLHSVIFGQGVPFFIDLTVPERGALLDEVLDLKIWQQASVNAGVSANAMEKEVEGIVREIFYTEGRIAALPDITALEQETRAWEANKEARLESAFVLLEGAEQELSEMERKRALAASNITAIPIETLRDISRQIEQHRILLANLSADYRVLSQHATAAHTQLAYLNEHANCPTCRQKYPQKERDAGKKAATTSIADLKHKITNNQAACNKNTQQVEELTAELDKRTRKREFFMEQLLTCDNEVVKQKMRVDQRISQVEAIGGEIVNPFKARLAQAIADADDAASTLMLHMDAKHHAEAMQQQYLYWRDAFKRVRLFMVQRILAHLQIEVSNAADILGLAGWGIEFVTETETRSGTIKQGVQVRITSPISTATWESWSGGEGQRIRLAVALGFASMIQRLGGVEYNFEVYDEPSAWLSPEGIEDLLECLKYRAEVSNKSIWLLDHRALIHSGFAEIWQVSKDGDGSHMDLITKAA